MRFFIILVYGWLDLLGTNVEGRRRLLGLGRNKKVLVVAPDWGRKGEFSGRVGMHEKETMLLCRSISIKDVEIGLPLFAVSA